MDRKTAWQRATSFISTIILAIFGFSGFAAADTLGATIINTGPGSNNTITTTSTDTCTVVNTNDVTVTEVNDQTATTGDVTVTNNTTAGSAESGDASNTNVSSLIIAISNDAPGPVAPTPGLVDDCGNPIIGSQGGGIGGTGPGSNNTITHTKFRTAFRFNNNRIGFGRSNVQRAFSGPVVVSSNTTGGSGSSGAASNSNTGSGSVGISNPGGGSGGGAPAPSGPTISNTGPGSNNTISSTSTTSSTTTNTNTIGATSYNTQTAGSGSATTTTNTTAGGAGSGGATNTNYSTENFTITN
jgi:hypothetical protein